MSCVAIVDYGMSNLHSVQQALAVNAPTGIQVRIVENERDIQEADKVVVPGQGAAAHCMRAINRRGLKEALIKAAGEKPFLGICMGLQLLLTNSSEDGGTACLDMFAGEVRRLSDYAGDYKIPHIGWNRVKQKTPHPLWEGIEDGSYFYFAHSYYALPENADLVCGTSEYGATFTSALANESVFAVQFHPEKSSSAGLRLLQNFMTWNGGV